MRITKDLREALHKLATGFELEEKTVTGGSGKAEKIKVLKRQVQPDLDAIKYINELKQVGIWQDEQE